MSQLRLQKPADVPGAGGRGDAPILRRGTRAEAGDSPVAALANRIVDNIEKVIVGKHNEIILTVMAYFAGGHVLLEDVPGVAKTVLARAFARTIGGHFQTHPMHAGFAAQRHHGQFHLQSQNHGF